jgi:phosphinothricin tripeptide acetyl hydrolase
MSHPGVESVRTLLEQTGMESQSIADQRAMTDGPGSPAPSGVVVDAVTLGGRPAEWLAPSDKVVDSVLLYFHGGGYAVGSIGSHRGLAGRIALEAGCQVANLDYRLAPEDPFPGAVDDATAAYRDLLALGIRPDKIAIGGDSAGGGLTMAALLAIRNHGMPLPAAAVCLSPWVDLTQSAATYDRVGDLDPMVSKAGLDIMAEAYLGERDRKTELASPLFAKDLSGLPPVMIEVGEHEVLLDDSLELAERLRAAGVDVSLTVWPEMIHVFQVFGEMLDPEASQSIAAIASFLATRLA